jgi:hypothetical protein
VAAIQHSHEALRLFLVLFYFSFLCCELHVCCSTSCLSPHGHKIAAGYPGIAPISKQEQAHTGLCLLIESASASFSQENKNVLRRLNRLPKVSGQKWLLEEDSGKMSIWLSDLPSGRQQGRGSWKWLLSSWGQCLPLLYSWEVTNLL